MAKNRKINGVLPRTFREIIMIGELVKCIWLEESVCIVIDRDARDDKSDESYCIYQVHDFVTGEEYWVDEQDLEKL